MASYKMLPEVLTWNPAPYATPIPSILVHGGLCAILMNFSFGTLVVLGELRAHPVVSVFVCV